MNIDQLKRILREIESRSDFITAMPDDWNSSEASVFIEYDGDKITGQKAASVIKKIFRIYTGSAPDELTRYGKNSYFFDYGYAWYNYGPLKTNLPEDLKDENIITSINDIVNNYDELVYRKKYNYWYPEKTVQKVLNSPKKWKEYLQEKKEKSDPVKFQILLLEDFNKLAELGLDEKIFEKILKKISKERKKETGKELW